MEKRLVEVDNMLIDQKEIISINQENIKMKDEIHNLKNENDFLKRLIKNKTIVENSNQSNSDDNSSTTVNRDYKFEETLESLKHQYEIDVDQINERDVNYSTNLIQSKDDIKLDSMKLTNKNTNSNYN